MCVNQRWIQNRYTRKWLYVKCGHCPACQQEKAQHRVNRIRNTYRDGLSCYMVSLTYDRVSVPYVWLDDLELFSKGKLMKLPFYREYTVRKVRKTTEYQQGYKKVFDPVKLGEIDFIDYSTLKNIRCAEKFGKRVGICYYPDYQQFMARFRLNLKRHYHYESDLFVYACSEYGSKTFRPHFHLLVFIDKSADAWFKDAVVESWPFSDLRQFPRSIEKAFRASTYVASYVNSGSKFPPLFKDYFKVKHSYSKGFGQNNYNFSLGSLLARLDRGDMSYNRIIDKQGIPTVISLPIPKYVIHRFFPQVKGYSRFSPDTLVENLRRIGRYEPFTKGELIWYSDDERRKYSVRLYNGWKRFNDEAPMEYKGFDGCVPFDLYIWYHERVWNLYHSTVLKLHMLNEDIPLLEKYDNLEELKDLNYHDKRYYLSLSGISPDMIEVTDPNAFKSVIRHTYKYHNAFNENIKHRRVNNAIYALDPNNQL